MDLNEFRASTRCHSLGGLPLMETALAHRKLGIVAHFARSLKGYAGVGAKTKRLPLASQMKFESPELEARWIHN